MPQDSSQYDKTFAWELDTMLSELETTLEAIKSATTPEEAAQLRESATRQNNDLVTLHGVDLGPF